MKKFFFLICQFFILVGCCNKNEIEEYPIIDIINNIGNYQRVYCSDLFSSIELIPLETKTECLLPGYPYHKVHVKDCFIFIHGNNGHIYAFDKLGNFQNEIGKRGQGVGEYVSTSRFFLDKDRPIIYVEDLDKILAYDFKGNFIRSFIKPTIGENILSQYSYLGEDLFVTQQYYNGKNEYKYCLVDQHGEIVNQFPNYIFFNRSMPFSGIFDGALPPFRIDDKLYVKDYVNDTIYSVQNFSLQPAYVFELGKYGFSIEQLEDFNQAVKSSANGFVLGGGLGIVGTPKFLFYEISIPDGIKGPKSKPRYNNMVKEYRPIGMAFGMYNIEEHTNILLDTDSYLQRGIINDLNGGLPIVPRYYAGDGIVVDVWNVEDMQEMLTEDYFASQEIKDPEGHQKLKEIVEKLQFDDNPVVVFARLK